MIPRAGPYSNWWSVSLDQRAVSFDIQEIQDERERMRVMDQLAAQLRLLETGKETKRPTVQT